VIRRLSADEARTVSAPSVPAAPGAESLRERLAAARRESELRSELEHGLRARLPALLHELAVAGASTAEVERRAAELVDQLFRSHTP
jgi:hypothetical protein